MWELLSVEDDIHILDYKSKNNEPIWFYMRYFVLYNYLLNKLSNIETIMSSETKKITLEAFRYMFRAVLHNSMLNCSVKKLEIAFYSPTDLILSDGIYIDRFTGFFLNIEKNRFLAFENAPRNWKWINAKDNDSSIMSAPNLATATIVSKIASENNDTTTELMEFVSKKIFEKFGITVTEEEKVSIIEMTQAQMKKSDLHSKWILKQCLKHGVKVFIMVGGAYSWNYAINRRLKEANIKTADLQHGYITKSNIVYNYHSGILESSELKIASPNFFLSYGDWWNSQTNILFQKKYSLGNPYRESSIEHFKKNNKNEIMIIGCARDTHIYCKLADTLGKKYGPERVVFRPHPSEHIYAKKIVSNNQLAFRIDFSRDIYGALQDTSIIISEISTVLFEAIGLVDKIIVWESDYSKYILPDVPFNRANNMDNLINIIEDKESRVISTQEYWKEDWKDNFFHFLELIDKQK